MLNLQDVSRLESSLNLKSDADQFVWLRKEMITIVQW